MNPSRTRRSPATARLKACRLMAASGLAPLCVVAITPGTAHASYGPYLHGDGIRSLGFGGVSQVAASEAFTLSANPALAPSLRDRYDVGLDLERVYPGAELHGNLLGPRRSYASSFQNIPVPQFGFTSMLSERVSVGMAGFAIGFGTSYHDSPFQRFGGATLAGATIAQAGLSNVLAWRPVEDQSFGLGLNLSYQLAEVKGLAPFKVVSQDPDHLSDQGRDGAAGIGFTLGWHAYLTPWLEAGASYHSKTWTQAFRQYAGLFPDGGKLEFPARFGGGLAIRPLPRLTVAVEALRVLYADETATGNLGIEKIAQGKRLGEQDGPGFGWRNQNIFKLGMEWQCHPQLALRAGYSHSTQMTRASETLLSIIAPATMVEHFTAGATFERRDGWQISGYVMAAPTVTVNGKNSIPLYLGGGESDVRNGSRSIGISLGRRFD